MTERPKISGLPDQRLDTASIEASPITVDSLLADNRSARATRRREEFEQDEESKSQIIIFRCSDARYILTYRKAIAISSIAAVGPKELFGKVSDKDGAPGIIALTHENCGGLGVKASLEEVLGLPEDANPTQQFVHDYSHDSDPVVEAAKSAKIISRIVTNKPVLAAVHKHETGDIIPLATYVDGQSTVGKEIPDTFTDFFDFQYRYVAGLKKRLAAQNIDLADIQQTQNPKLMVITRDIRPLEVTLPVTTQKPGSAFRISSSRPVDGNLDTVSYDDMNLVMKQAYYPLTHFNALNRILISTESIDASVAIATNLLDMTDTKIWHAKPGSQIYVAKAIHGLIEDIYEFPFKKAA